MAKLVVLITVLLAIIANAFAYRTTVTTVEVDEANPRSREQSCRMEAQMKDLSACEQYIRQSRMREDEVLALRREGNQQDRQLRMCCSQFRNVRDECQCEALRSVVEEQMQGRTEEYHQMMQKASNIPSACGFREGCDFRRIVF